MWTKRHWRALQLAALVALAVFLFLRPSLRTFVTIPLSPASHPPQSPASELDIPDPVQPPELAPPSPPLTSLGEDADASFHISAPESYAEQLGAFVRRAFPKYLHAPLLEALVAPPADPPTPIPKKIWQTHRSQDSAPLDTTRTWWETNRETDGWNRTFLSDDDADRWVREWVGGPGESEIAWVWNTLPRGVLRSDMLRYLVLLLEGGVYSDTDTICLKPISRWGRFAEVWTVDPGSEAELGEQVEQAWEGDREESARGDPPRGVIVGVEADVGTRPDWHQWWPRPLQIVQWTLAAPPHHPVMLDALRRVHAATAFAASWVVLQNATHPEGKAASHNRPWEVKDAREELGGPMSVMEWTGPGVFTDAALTYLTSATAPRECKGWLGQGCGRGEPSFTWPLLKGLEVPIRVADVTILPVTGTRSFSSLHASALNCA
ncbi:glycosyltransferase family 32 protein [Calocera viscosa TUFC12733]|uniref:Glycosyltransferase family 32 protein n=1 Tax=Calocera viscosa (strain TUFC12733) TaxID=1330018 RepID=A0A167RE21_CALVF|nr:glycosyltransferase family 32 protein [Calocera viscosa TUFC12733]